MDKAQIQGIFEKNLLEEKVQTDDSHLQVYTRNVRLNVKDPFTYKCNICQMNDIEGQQALFEHNKSANHIEKVTELSDTHINERKIASLSTVEEAIQTLDMVYHYYEKCPDKHPSYQNDWAKYYQNRKKELLAEFRNVETYDFTDEWTIYWNALRKEYHKKNVAECLDYIDENYTMNNHIDSTPRSTSTVDPSLESGKLRDTPPKRKERHHRSKKKSSLSRRRSRSLSRRRSSQNSSARRSSSIERRWRRRRHSRSRSKSSAVRRAWSRGRSKARWTSPKHYTVGRSRSVSRSRSRSPFVARFRSRGCSPNGARTLGDLRFSINKRRQQRDRSKPVTVGRHQPKDHPPSRIDRSSKLSPIFSDNNSVDVPAPKPTIEKLVPPKPTPSNPAEPIESISSDSIPPKPMPSNPGQILPRCDSPAQNRPKTVAPVPLKPVPLPGPSPSPSISAIPAIPPIKSILKKSSASKENAFARATRVLSSSNSNMHYNKIELKMVVDASKRVLKFLSSFKSGSYPEYIRLDITLLSTQVRNILESISIDPSTLSDDEVQTLLSNYMTTMSNDRVIVKQQTPVATAKVNKDAAPVASRKPLSEALNGMNRSTNEPKNVAPTMASAPPPAQTRSRIDRTTQLNDIDVAKSPVQKPSTTCVHSVDWSASFV